MSTGYLIKDPSAAHFLTFTVVDWVDVFARARYCDIVIDSMKFCREHKGLKIWGYVIMTNHMHSIFSAVNGNLPDVLRDFKRHTASKILHSIREEPESRRDWMLKRFEFAARSNVRNGQYQFWQHDNHAEEIISEKFLAQKLNYIHLNPVRAGLVKECEHWVYSSMSNYLLQDSILEIDLAELSR
jgi:REP element-mobilizing transposase RayT